MYQCKTCGEYFQDFVTPGQCPKCFRWVLVQCTTCLHTDEARTFIANGNRCPKCNLEVSIPGANDAKRISPKDLMVGVGALLLLTSC